MASKPWMRCPLSGATENLRRVKLIPLDYTANEDELQVACMEWVWGLKRGGLHYHLATPHNSMFLREDIAHLYATFQFILAPTFSTHVAIMEFLKTSGVKDRKKSDRSPRRPLTALTPPSGFYRYVFIPFSDAARKLQEELKLQLQTEDDLADGIDPVSGDPLVEGTEAFPVVECFGHPFYASTLAEHAFRYHQYGNLITSQWSISVLCIINQWNSDTVSVPKWFVDMPGMDEDDITMTSSEGEGYTISSKSADPEGRPRIPFEGEELLRANVSEWAAKVDPESKPEEQPPVPRSPLRLRRSERLKNKAHPYRSQSPIYPPLSPVRQAPWPCERDADPATYPPAWIARKGRYPARQFTSNDWAYFCHNVALAASPKS